MTAARVTAAAPPSPAPEPPELPELRLLDTPHLRLAAARIDLPASAPGLLLARLGLQGDWLAREHLMALFWPEASEADAQHHLRVTLHRARLWLASHGLAESLVGERRRLRLALACDVPQFRVAIGCGDWAGAVALYRAPLWAGAVPKGFAAIDEWLTLERDALTTAWRNAALREAARLEAAADAPAAAALLQALLRIDLLAEDVVQALLRVAAAAGERSTALHTFEQFRERAASELGLEPLPGTLVLAQTLRQLRPDARPVLQPTTARGWDRTGARPGARPGGLPGGLPGALPGVRPGALLGGLPAGLALALPVRLPATLLTPPLIGRQAEAQRVRAAGPGLTLVSGEPGIGKTRLVQDSWPGATVWRCRDGLQTVPLLPAAQWLRDHARRVRQRIKAAATLRELARLEPALAAGELLPPADAQSPALLLALCRSLPLLTDTLVIDDLQWVDSATLQLLRMLADDTPLRLVATLRPAQVPAEVAQWLTSLQAAGRIQQIELAALPGPATAELLAQLAGHSAPHFAAWLQRASGGNPFFALETLRALFGTGQLRSEDGGWASDLDALSGDYGELPVPQRVAAVVQQRLHGLAESSQRVLLAAAVVGHAAHEELLAQMVGVSAWATAQALAQAQQAGLLAGSAFAHDLTREALLLHTPMALQRVLHASVVRHALTHPGLALGPHQRAHHAWAAGLQAEAVAATLAAALHDRERGLLDQAQALLTAAEQRTQERGLRAQLAAERAECAESAGQTAQAAAHAQAVLDSSGDPKLRARALGTQVVVLLHQGQLAEAQALAEHVLTVDPDWPDRHTLGAKLAYAASDFNRAIEHMRQHVALLQARGGSADLAAALSGLATAMAGQGQLDDAAPLHRQAIAMARQYKARYFEVYAVSNYLWTAARLPAGHQDAAALGRTALALGEYTSSSRLRVNLGAVLQRLGAHAEAAALYEHQAQHGSDPTVAAVCWARLVELRAQQGRVDASLKNSVLHEAIDRGLAMLVQTDAPLAQASVVTAALEHGNTQQVQQALAAVRDWPLPADLQQRLQAARRLRLGVRS
jgi:DNA-binding SARP family transcriptional activator